MLLTPAMVEWGKRLLTVCGVAAGLASIALGLLVSFQEKLIYIPRIPGMPALEYDDPSDFNLESEVVDFTTVDGTRICGWFMHPKGWTAKKLKQRPTILFLQENAGTMAMRLHFFAELVRYVQCSVLAPSYRGYRLNGKVGSGGAPNERGLKQDTQAALDYLLSRPDVHPKQISVMGKSLGGATAIHLAAANPGKIHTLVVENTFTSIEDVAHKVLPPLKYVIGRNKPLNFLVRNKWRNHEAIGRSFIQETPTLLLSSLQDEMLPPEQMRELYTIAKSAGAKDITWVDFESANHMNAYVVAHNYWPAVIHFYRSHHDNALASSDSEASSGGFEDVGSDSAVQAMLKAEKEGSGPAVTRDGVRVRHHEERS